MKFHIVDRPAPKLQTLLNVGGGSRDGLPAMFDGWAQHLLDINPDCNPDLEMDARNLIHHDPAIYDAVYASHFLEHVYTSDVPKVLAGFHRVLVPGGFISVVVPDIGALLKAIQGRDIHDTWYMTGDGQAISFHDVLYGWGRMIAAGNEFYAHKTAFTGASLDAAVKQFFPVSLISSDGYNLFALAIKGP